MLEEDRRVVAAHRSAQQTHGVLARSTASRPASRCACAELHLVALAVPGIAALEEAAGHAHDDRRGEAVRRAPAHRAAVVELLRRGIGVLAELDLRHGHQPGERHADRAADDALLGQARCRTRAPSPNFSCSPERRRVHAALAARRPRRTRARFGLTASSCSSVRRIAVSMLMRGPSVSRLVEPSAAQRALGARPPCCLQLERAVRASSR